VATIPPTNEPPLPSHSVPCPACGVPVARGYLRCPKCKANVPQAPRARRGSVREELLAGGTSVESPSNVGAWLPWVLVALLIVGVGAFVAFRSGGKASKPGPAKVEEPDDDTDTDVEDDDEASDDDDDVASPGRATGPRDRTRPADPMREAADALDEDLRDARLWAKVTHDDSAVLRVESSLCPQIEENLAELAARARALGARQVECHAQHGQVMFERGL